MPGNPPPDHQTIDLAIKRLVRDNPVAFFELIGHAVPGSQISFEDTAIQQRERRADHTCILTEDNGAMRGIIYLEYQLIPDADLLIDWIWKWAGLLHRFRVPVVMLVVYLHRGNYATFHKEYRAHLDGFETVVQFNTIRFWECAPQIRSGQYPDFVPLLTLCEDHPTEETVRDQVRLIQTADLEEARKQELLSLSFLVASRDVAHRILVPIIKETFAMNTLPPIMEDMFGEALHKRDLEAALREARSNLLRLYTKRLGAPSPEVIARLEAIQNVEDLHATIDRYDEPLQTWEQLFPA